MRAVVSKQLEAQKITMMEWLTLGVVMAGPKDGVSMSQIATTLDVTLPQVTALISNLLDAKMIKQQILASDRRGRQVTGTTRGKKAWTRLEDSIAEAMRTWSKGIDRAQLKTYILTVAKLSKKNKDLFTS